MNFWRMRDGSKHWLRAGAPSVCLGLACAALLSVCSRAQAQNLDQAQRQYLNGRYDAALETARKKLEAGEYGDGWRVLLVKSLLTLGRYAEARTNALAGVADFPGSMQLRLLAREADLFQNDTAGADRQLNEIKSLIERRGRVDQSGDNLVALGKALLLLGIEPRLALENCFQRTYAMDPPIREAYLAAGQLALDKHDFPLAADSFRAGLKKFPDDPDMNAGLAQAFETGDRVEMLKALDAALAVNSRHIPSLLLLAGHLIDAEQYDEADRKLDRVLEVNPWRPEALAYRAFLAQARHDLPAVETLRAKALKFWPANPQVDYLIGLKLAQKYLFEEGAAAQRRALAFAPGYLPASRQLAENLLRLGQDEEGWRLAREARARDEYDVTTYNLSNLGDQMAKFRTLTNADFILRMSPLEARLYGDRALDLLGRAKAVLCRKYGVALNRPTVVEIFPDQKDFAVRTFGMPGNPGYLGVCFGSVITANSPASQLPNPANWEDVLWHEFCHVVTLNYTRNRMPRWLSEGISVYEERQADPAWGERMNLAYRDMILRKELTPLAELSGAFLRPKNSKRLQFAYYESSLVVEFLNQQFGLETLKQILTDLREGMEVNQAMATRAAPLAELEKRFAAFVRAQAENLAPGADLDPPPAKEAEGEKATWEALHPQNYHVRLRKAREFMEAKRWTEARPILQSLAASYHGERRGDNPLWLEAVAERSLNDTNAEWATLGKFAEQESDFVDLSVRLVELAGQRADWSAEARYAERLLQVNPLIPLPYRALAESGVASENKDQAIAAYRCLLLLDPPDPAEIHFRLARLLRAHGGMESEAKRHVLEALEEAPRYQEARRLLLEIEATSAKSENPPIPQTRS